MSKVVFTITGPTCGGKTVLEKRLIEEGFAKITSHTTRPQRAGEIHGKDYHFVSPIRFLAMTEDGDMAENVEFGGYRYGASKTEFEKAFAAGKPVVLVCEPVGRKQIEAVAEREGWTLIRAFVDIAPVTQAFRFLDRFASEVACLDLSCRMAKTDTYAGRLAEIMTTEKSWVAEAYAHSIHDPDSAYEVLIDRYDEQTEEDVVALLVEMGKLYTQAPANLQVA